MEQETAGSTADSQKDTMSVETQQAFIGLLKSMGVTDFEPAVIVALEEHARRVSSDLLCDAKDYATHAGRKDIGMDDVTLAIKVRDSRRAAPSTRIRAMQDDVINSQPLPPFPEGGVTLNPDKIPMFKTRPYTYVPGSVAYSDQSTTASLSANVFDDANQQSNSKSKNKKSQIPIVLHPEKRGNPDGGSTHRAV